MAEASRVLIGLVCGLFILSAIPYTTAQEGIDLEDLSLEFDNQFELWYEIGEVIDINPILTNYDQHDQIHVETIQECNFIRFKTKQTTIASKMCFSQALTNQRHMNRYNIGVHPHTYEIM